jgi:hypothetical protein
LPILKRQDAVDADQDTMEQAKPMDQQEQPKMCQWPVPPAERTFDLSLLPDLVGEGIRSVGIDDLKDRWITLTKSCPPQKHIEELQSETKDLKAGVKDLQADVKKMNTKTDAKVAQIARILGKDSASSHQTRSLRIGEQPGAKQLGTANPPVQYHQPIQYGFGGRPPLESGLEKDCLHTTREHLDGHDSYLGPLPNLMENTLDSSSSKESTTVSVRRRRGGKGSKRAASSILQQDAKKARVEQSEVRPGTLKIRA